MLSIFNDVKSLFKIGSVVIDNLVFKLHYKLTVIILVVFSIIVNSTQYFGDPIDCTRPETQIAPIVDTFCWFNSYTLVAKDGAVKLQVQNALAETASDWRSYKKVKLTYYQWIGIILLLQAGLFYFPRFLWRFIWEEGRVKELVSQLKSHVFTDDEITQKQASVIEYVFKNQGQHTFYVIKFCLCEILNFCNVIFNIVLTDWFLGHVFWNFGSQWLFFDDLNEEQNAFYRPLDRYFPKQAVCDIKSGSDAGIGQNVFRALCILPVQVFNEKIYIFLWFYFIVLTVISGLQLVYRCITLFSPQVRLYLLRKQARVTDKDILRRVAETFDIGDWFIIYQIGKNMDPFVFGKLMDSLDEKIEKYNGKYAEDYKPMLP